MAIVVFAALILLTLIGCSALAAGSVLLAEVFWRRRATADLIAQSEQLLRRQAASDIV